MSHQTGSDFFQPIMATKMEEKDIAITQNPSPETAGGQPLYGSITDSIDPVIARQIKRKADLILLPMLAVMYLFK